MHKNAKRALEMGCRSGGAVKWVLADGGRPGGGGAKHSAQNALLSMSEASGKTHRRAVGAVGRRARNSAE